MSQKLRQGVNEHLNQYQLDNNQLEALMAMQTAAASNLKPELKSESKLESKPELQQKPNKTLLQPRFVKYATAAVLVLALMMTLQAQFVGTHNIAMSEQIAMETAKNHIKLKPLEVTHGQFSPVRNYFTELDFSPQISRYFTRKNHTLLGARYCSIAGVSAAQLRYQTDNGQIQTLYQVGYAADIYGPIPNRDKGEAPLESINKGIKSTLWVENGLLMVSTEDANGDIE